MRHTLLAVAGISSAAVAVATPGLARARDDAAAVRIAETMLAAQVEMNGVPGMAATVTRDGHIVWEGASGLRDVARNLPVTRQTSFRLASVSKLLTATAAIKLHDEGRLDLDRPVQDLVPGLNRAWPPINARQLAAHTSGLPHYQDMDADLGSKHFPTVRDALRNLAGRSLLSPPGSAYEYSSWGYTLLSAVVEAAAGKPFADYTARSITHGLEIVPGTNPSDDQFAAGYRFVEGVAAAAPAHDYSYSLGGAGFRGSATAVAMFGGRVMDDAFLSADARRMMWTPSLLADASPVRERDSDVAFGWRIGRDPSGDRIVHHAGTTPDARSVLVLYPDERLAVAVLSNAGWVSSIDQTAAMLAAPFRVKEGASGPRCPTKARHYQGSFGSERISGTAKFELIDGHCQGRISIENAAGQWFNSYPQKDTKVLRVLALIANGGLGRAALVTPLGVYDFRGRADGSYVAPLGSNRELNIRFAD